MTMQVDWVWGKASANEEEDVDDKNEEKEKWGRERRI